VCLETAAARRVVGTLKRQRKNATHTTEKERVQLYFSLSLKWIRVCDCLLSRSSYAKLQPDSELLPLLSNSNRANQNFPYRNSYGGKRERKQNKIFF
jgi:hypothetical protein